MITFNQFRPRVGDRGFGGCFINFSGDRIFGAIRHDGFVCCLGAALDFLSFLCHVGQTFYRFGWETLLLETGFLAIFLGSADTASPPSLTALSTGRQGLLIALATLIFALSIKPPLNLFSRRQLMNASFDPLHLVNTYGAFGSITRKRYEIILEGTQDSIITASTVCKAYEFKAKPGALHRRPALVSPYHDKLDWQMWFAAMSSYYDHPWILSLIAKLLQGDAATLGLMGKNPFPHQTPSANPVGTLSLPFS